MVFVKKKKEDNHQVTPSFGENEVQENLSIAKINIIPVNQMKVHENPLTTFLRFHRTFNCHSLIKIIKISVFHFFRQKFVNFLLLFLLFGMISNSLLLINNK